MARLTVTAVSYTHLDVYKRQRPYLAAGRVTVAELVLRPDLVFQGTPLEAVGHRGQGAALQALLLQGQPLAVPRGLVDVYKRQM